MAMTTFLTVAAVLAGLVALVVLAVIAVRGRSRNRPLRLVDLLAPLGAAGLVLAVTAVAAFVKGVDSRAFALFHIAYLGLVVTLPMLGVGLVLVAVARRAVASVAVVGSVLLLAVPIGWYATHWAPYALEVDRATLELPAARAGDDVVRVGVLSDLQTNTIGSYERRVVRTLQALRPDLIVIPGDLFQGDAEQFRATLPAYRELLGSLEAPAGVFVVEGDSETEDRLERLVEGTGIRILDNEVVDLTVGDRQVRLGGNPLRWAPLEGVAVRDDLIGSDDDAVRLLVAHRPEVVLGLAPDAGIDLVIAGHTHGGQVALPLLGPVITQSPVSRTVARGGLHEVAGNPIYVSTGAGMVRQQAPQIRFLTRPSVGLVTLR